MGLVVSALSLVDVWLYHRKQAWIWYVLDAWQFLLREVSGLKLWGSRRGQDGHRLTSARGNAAQCRGPNPPAQFGAWLPLQPGACILLKTWASLSPCSCWSLTGNAFQDTFIKPCLQLPFSQNYPSKKLLPVCASGKFIMRVLWVKISYLFINWENNIFSAIL